MKPRIFVASSFEGVQIAWAIQENLRHVAECTVWTQGVFELNESSIETLLKSLEHFEYGIFVFNPDDVAKIRQKTVNVTRDNVIFELGLFYGSHGKQRNFIIAPQGVNLHVPTDLLGIAPATFDPNHSDGNLSAALGPACTQIIRAINKSSEFGHLSESAEVEQVSRQWSNSFINVSKSRRDSIRGRWQGTVIPRNSSKLRDPLGKLKPQKVDMSFDFKPGMKLITATSTFQSPITERGPILNDYVGGFLTDDRFRLDYRKHNPAETGFGTMLFEIGADGVSIKVHMVGYSSHFKQVYFAEAVLHPVLQAKNIVNSAVRRSKPK